MLGPRLSASTRNELIKLPVFLIKWLGYYGYLYLFIDEQTPYIWKKVQFPKQWVIFYNQINTWWVWISGASDFENEFYSDCLISNLILHFQLVVMYYSFLIVHFQNKIHLHLYSPLNPPIKSTKSTFTSKIQHIISGSTWDSNN